AAEHGGRVGAFKGGVALRIGPAPPVGAAARRVQVIRPRFWPGSPAGVRGGRVRVRPGTNVPRRRPPAGASSLISSPDAPAPAWTHPGGTGAPTPALPPKRGRGCASRRGAWRERLPAAGPCRGGRPLRRNQGGGFRLQAEAGGHLPRGPATPARPVGPDAHRPG